MSDRDRSRALVEAVLSGAAEPEPDDGSRALLVFEVADAVYAIDATRVEAVAPASYVAPVPYGPPSVLGVTSIRGRMRLVVDVGGARIETASYLVTLHGDAHLAILADRVSGVRRVASGEPDAFVVLDPDLLVANGEP